MSCLRMPQAPPGLPLPWAQKSLVSGHVQSGWALLLCSSRTPRLSQYVCVYPTVCVCVQLFSVCDCMSRRIYMYLLIERYHSPYCYYHYCYDSTYYYCIPVRVRLYAFLCLCVWVCLCLCFCLCSCVCVQFSLWGPACDKLLQIPT